MGSQSAVTGYTPAQILLHWIVAALVVFQLFVGEDIIPAYRAIRHGGTPAPSDQFNANLHIYAGLAILLLAFLRLALRLKNGTPPYPAGEKAWQKRIASAVHILLYAVIFAMPVTGALAWYAGIHAMGEVHQLAKPLIIAAILLHAAAAFWHHFILKSNVLVRMLKPQRQAAL